MLLDIVQRNKKIYISKINKEDELEFIEIPIPKKDMYNWVLNNPGGNLERDYSYSYWYKNLPVYKTKTNYLGKYRVIEFLEGLSPDIKKDIFEYNKPSILHCDIETEVIDGFPDTKNPKEMVTAIGVFDDKTRKATVYGIKPLAKSKITNIYKKIIEYFKNFPECDGLNFEYVYYSNEYDMLYHVFKHVFKNANILTGWNFIEFDWAYLLARCRKLGIDPSVCTYDGKLYYKNETPKHKFVFDYMDIVKKWGYVDKKVDNFSLDTVSNYLLGVNKISYTGSLQDLYVNDFETYIYYNIVDVILVYLIDKYKKTFNTFLNLAKLGGIESRLALSPVQFTNNVLCKEFYKVGKVLVDKDNPFSNENIEYGDYRIKGAHVFEPVPGIHEGVASSDFASLYPTIMRMFNISPESYLGKADKIKVDPDTMIVTSMNTVFSKKESVTKRLLDYYYSERLMYQGKLQDVNGEINEIKQELKKRKLI